MPISYNTIQISDGDIKVSVERYPDGKGGMRKILVGMKIPFAAPPLGPLRFKVGPSAKCIIVFCYSETLSKQNIFRHVLFYYAMSVTLSIFNIRQTSFFSRIFQCQPHIFIYQEFPKSSQTFLQTRVFQGSHTFKYQDFPNVGLKY